MSVKAFLLKLVGQHPEQVEEKARFEENMRGLDARHAELDNLLEGIKEVDQTLREKSEALHTTATSMKPEGRTDEREPEESGEVLVHLNGEPGPVPQ